MAAKETIQIGVPKGKKAYFLPLFHRIIAQADPVYSIVLKTFEENPDLSIGKIQTMLNHKGIHKNTTVLRNFAKKCGLNHQSK